MKERGDGREDFRTLEEFQREHIREALEATGHHLRLAARRLDIPLKELQHLIEKHGLGSVPEE